MSRAPSHSRQVSIDSPDVSHWGLPHPPKDPTESHVGRLIILVCADIDIDSSSALVDYTLQQREFDMSLIDLIVAVGPFSKEGDLDRYRYIGHQQQRQQKDQSHIHGGNVRAAMLPLLRTYEKSCAMEGLVSSCLAQLENIVCRVAYCPALSDPVTILRDPSKRLTSNSRNIHKQSLALVPGLSVAGLMYIDGVDEMVRELALTGSQDDRDGEEDASVSENSNTLNVLETLVNQLQKVKCGADYETTLDQLVGLSQSTSADTQDPECTTNILVTHYAECQNPGGRTDYEGEDDESGSDHLTATIGNEIPPGHLAYLESRRRSICLEISSGGSQSQPSYDESLGLMRTGSLRNFGVFSLVTLEIDSGASQWGVKSVEHRSIRGYREQR